MKKNIRRIVLTVHRVLWKRLDSVDIVLASPFCSLSLNSTVIHQLLSSSLGLHWKTSTHHVCHYNPYLQICLLARSRSCLYYWTWTFHFEKASNVFRPLYAGGLKNVGFVFDENLVMEFTQLSWCHRFLKALFAKQFLPTQIKSWPFQIPPVWRPFFRKLPFVWWISVDGRPYHRNKAAFLNSSSIVWTGLKMTLMLHQGFALQWTPVPQHHWMSHDFLWLGC